jgi:hypothetical protein
LPENATKAVLPPTLTPQLATLVDGPLNDPNEWTYEIKFDGYRILARIEEKKIQLFTRNGNDWSHKLPHIEEAIATMDFQSGCWTAKSSYQTTLAFLTSKHCKMHLVVPAPGTSSISFLTSRFMLALTLGRPSHRTPRVP